MIDIQNTVERVEAPKNVESQKESYESRLEKMNRVLEKIKIQELAEEPRKAPGGNLDPFDDIVVSSARAKMGETEWAKWSRFDTYIKGGIICERRG